MSQKTKLRILMLVTVFVFAAIELSKDFLYALHSEDYWKEYLAALDASGYHSLPGSLLMVSFFGGLIGFAGLWWCKRWARFVFSAAVFLYPLTSLALHVIVHPALMQARSFPEPPRPAFDPVFIFPEITGLFIGAIVALIWFGMPDEFKRSSARPSIGAPAHRGDAESAWSPLV